MYNCGRTPPPPPPPPPPPKKKKKKKKDKKPTFLRAFGTRFVHASTSFEVGLVSTEKHNKKTDWTDNGQAARLEPGEEKKMLPTTQGGYRAGSSTFGNASRFTHDVYKWFQRKEQILAVSVDLEDA